MFFAFPPSLKTIRTRHRLIPLELSAPSWKYVSFVVSLGTNAFPRPRNPQNLETRTSVTEVNLIRERFHQPVRLLSEGLLEGGQVVQVDLLKVSGPWKVLIFLVSFLLQGVERFGSSKGKGVFFILTLGFTMFCMYTHITTLCHMCFLFG